MLSSPARTLGIPWWARAVGHRARQVPARAGTEGACGMGGDRECSNGCCRYPGLGVLVGMWYKPWDNAGRCKASKSACKFLSPISLPCLCSSNLLQSSSNVPNNFGKPVSPERNCSHFGRGHASKEDPVKNTINYKCLSVISELPIWPAGRQMAVSSSQAHPNCISSWQLFL